MKERIFALADLAPDSVVAIDTLAHGRVALYRTGSGLYATQDLCTHGNASLADGFLEGDEIECPLHAGRFCVRTGQATEAPADVPLRTFRLSTADGEIFIEDEAA